MQSLVNKKQDVWLRPWDLTKNDIDSEHDERYFSLLIKGVLSWLNRNIVMYGKSIRHFILNTGSSYLYLENNDSSSDFCETSGENWLYMERPRCIVTLGSINIPTEEMGAVSSPCQYERKSNAEDTKGQILAYNSYLQRMPIEWQIDLKYIFDTFNESICFVQEMLEKILFQKYFTISYLGQLIECSIEFNKDSKIEFNQIDLASKDPNQKTFDLSIIVHSNLPIIDTDAEVRSTNIISKGTVGIVDMKSGEQLGKYSID